MNIEIKRAQTSDIPIIENILSDTANWLNEMNQPLWSAETIKWSNLSKSFMTDDFYIAYLNDAPAGCVAIIDYDPFFWEDVPKGESLFIHKLAVKKSAKKMGVSDALMDFFKEKGKLAGVKSLRLETHAMRLKVRAFYERHGFILIEEKLFHQKYHTAFYMFTLLCTGECND